MNSTARIRNELGLESTYPIRTDVDPAEAGETMEVAFRQRYQTVVRGVQLLQRRQPRLRHAYIFSMATVGVMSYSS